MKFKTTALLAAIVAALATQGVMAQDAASGPKARAEVKAETKAAVKTGNLPTDAADQGLAKPKAKAKKVKGKPKAPAVSEGGKTRSDVKAETKASMKAGDMPKGDVPDMTKPK
ncbi:MAG: DUF4148 domain-containing protein [Cytophagales bacterium]|nr:DUF4148 domain-containing protein [Rhizobacter sp.]